MQTLVQLLPPVEMGTTHMEISMQNLMRHDLFEGHSYQTPEEYTLQQSQLRLAIERIYAEVKQEMADDHTLSYAEAVAKVVDYIAFDLSMDD